MSTRTTENDDSVSLHAEDLIDDRELVDVGDDRLAHEGIVGQLASLVWSVRTPSNIALYGPWGSGKSGIANLLQSRIDRKNGIRFVRFDAFKYADVPLRRNFISAVAKGLGHEDSKYHADLYSGRTKTDISVPPATILKLLGVFALLMAALTFDTGRRRGCRRLGSARRILGLVPCPVKASHYRRTAAGKPARRFDHPGEQDVQRRPQSRETRERRTVRTTLPRLGFRYARETPGRICRRTRSMLSYRSCRHAGHGTNIPRNR